MKKKFTLSSTKTLITLINKRHWDRVGIGNNDAVITWAQILAVLAVFFIFVGNSEATWTAKDGNFN